MIGSLWLLSLNAFIQNFIFKDHGMMSDLDQGAIHSFAQSTAPWSLDCCDFKLCNLVFSLQKQPKFAWKCRPFNFDPMTIDRVIARICRLQTNRDNPNPEMTPFDFYIMVFEMFIPVVVKNFSEAKFQ